MTTAGSSFKLWPMSRSKLSLEKRKEILEEPVYPLLFRMGWPGALSLFFQSSFNLVDRYFVSRLGEEELASVGLAFVIQSLVIAVAGGLASGVRSHSARSAGADRKDAVCRGAEHLAFFVLALGGLLALAGPFFSWSVYRLMGVDAAVMTTVMSYTTIILYGSVFHLISMGGNSLLRGIGEMKAPMRYLSLSVLINLVLDPLLIFGIPGFGAFSGMPGLGIRGAALATVLGRAAGCLFLIRHLIEKGILEPRNLFPFHPDREVVRSLFKVGIPAMLTRSLNALGMGLVYALVTPFGMGATAAYTAGMAFQRLLLIPANGLSGAAVTMIGQNGGAGQKHRVGEVYRKAQIMTLLIIGAFSLLIFTGAPMLSRLLLHEQESRSVMVLMLRLLSPGYFFMASRIITVGGLNVLGFSLEGMTVSLLQKFVLTFPLAWLLSRYFGLAGIWSGLTLGHAAAALGGMVVFIYSLKRKEILL